MKSATLQGQRLGGRVGRGSAGAAPRRLRALPQPVGTKRGRARARGVGRHGSADERLRVSTHRQARRARGVLGGAGGRPRHEDPAVVEGARHHAPVSGGDGARLPGHPGRGRAGGAGVLGRRGPGPAQAWVAERESCACVHVPEELAAAGAPIPVSPWLVRRLLAPWWPRPSINIGLRLLVFRGPWWAGSIRSALGQPWQLRAHRPAWPRGLTTAHKLGFEAGPTAEFRLEKPGQDRSWAEAVELCGALVGPVALGLHIPVRSPLGSHTAGLRLRPCAAQKLP
jgi:hypothetical protein